VLTAALPCPPLLPAISAGAPGAKKDAAARQAEWRATKLAEEAEVSGAGGSCAFSWSCTVTAMVRLPARTAAKCLARTHGGGPAAASSRARVVDCSPQVRLRVVGVRVRLELGLSSLVAVVRGNTRFAALRLEELRELCQPLLSSRLAGGSQRLAG
jgi:hypothetical protein